MPRLVVTLLVLAFVALAAPLAAVAQSMPAINIAVGKDPGDRLLIATGAELDSKVSGYDKDQPPRLWILGQSQPFAMTGDDKNPNRWTVNLPAALCKELRHALTIVYIEYGTMLAGPIGVPIDDLTPVTYMPDLKLTQLPAGILGVLTGDQTHSATFTGKKGDRVQVEIEARRLGGKLRPVIHLYDSRKVQLAWAQSSRTAGGDARLSYVLPSDGDYRVEWHDALFKGEAPGTYRVKVGQYDNISHQYPLVVDYSDVIPSGPMHIPLNQRKTSDKLRVSQFLNDGSIRFVEGRASVAPGAAAWPSMSHRLSSVPQAVEAQRSEAANWEHPAVERRMIPVGLNGILANAGEEDRWTIDVLPGKTYRFDVLAADADSPVDAVLTLYDGEGKKQLMTADDATKSADPTLEYTVPQGMKILTVAIKDLLGRGGWEYAYNIEVTAVKEPFVTAIWPEETLYVPSGSRNISRLKVKRQNYNGQISFTRQGQNSIPLWSGSTDQLIETTGSIPPFDIYVSRQK